jgi:segregation and condensation protein A
MDGAAPRPPARPGLTRVDLTLDRDAEAGTDVGAAQGGSPGIALEGFSGPLERLLALARAQAVDLARIPVVELVTQVADALGQAGPGTPIEIKGDWLVMAAWLLLLRSRLMLPPDAPARTAALREAETVRGDLLALDRVKGLATWLDARPQLGRDVFAHGAADGMVTPFRRDAKVDAVEFLWATIMLLDGDGPKAGRTDVYRPAWMDLHTVPEARDRIRRLLADAGEAMTLEALLPAAARAGLPDGMRRRSGWTSTFVASLELAKQGEVALAQDGAFATIRASAAPAS